MKKLTFDAGVGESHITCQPINLTSRNPVYNTRCRVQVISTASVDEILEKCAYALRTAAGPTPVSSLKGNRFGNAGILVGSFIIFPLISNI